MNVKLVSRAWVKRLSYAGGSCSGEIQTMQSVGNSLGMTVLQVRAGAYIPIGWKIVFAMFGRERK